MNIYKLIIEYNGKNFFGSQRQRSLRTVEQVLNSVISQLLTSKYNLYFCSRTDTGVSALCNVVKLVCSEKLNAKDFLAKLNYFLPKDLQVIKITKLKKNFDIRNVKYKVYQYLIYNSEYNHPTLFYDNVWWVKDKIHMHLLRKAAKIVSLQKKFDFATTRDYIKTRRTTKLSIKIQIKKIQQFIFVKFIGKKFIHRIIRNIVSLLVSVATKKISIDELQSYIKSWKYCRIKPAPAKGLILVKVVL